MYFIVAVFGGIVLMTLSRLIVWQLPSRITRPLSSIKASDVSGSSWILSKKAHFSSSMRRAASIPVYGDS